MTSLGIFSIKAKKASTMSYNTGRRQRQDTKRVSQTKKELKTGTNDNSRARLVVLETLQMTPFENVMT
jgi:hypothetical protein